MSFLDKFSSRGSADSTSITERIIKEKALVYALWLNQSRGRRAYAIIHVDSAKQPAFKRFLDEKKTADIREFGKILYLEWSEPTEEIKAEMHHKYGLYSV